MAGIIRLDNFRVLVRGGDGPGWKNEIIMTAIKKALGNTCDYDSPAEAWDNCNVPMGSEGSLQYRVSPYTDIDNNQANWGYVSIWGDLRDFGMDRSSSINAWFKKALTELAKPVEWGDPDQMGARKRAEYLLSCFIIRDAVLVIEVEGQPKTVLVWDPDARSVKECPLSVGGNV